jgi:hypothetical protein
LTPINLADRRVGSRKQPSQKLVAGELGLLGDLAQSKKATPFPIRARFVLMLETGLRPKTLDQLRVPEHYAKGASVLRVTADIDKNEFARDLSLTDTAYGLRHRCATELAATGDLTRAAYLPR